MTVLLKTSGQRDLFSRPVPLCFAPTALLLVFLCAALPFFAGCAGLLEPGPPPARVQLHPTMPDRLPFTVNVQLIVAQPQAGRDLDTDGMALLFNGREIRYLSGLRWNMSLPTLLQSKLVDAVQASGCLRGVADDTSGINATARLLCDVHQFSLQYTNEQQAPTAVVEFVLRLVDQRNGSLIGTKTVAARIPAAGTDTTNLVQAYEDALSAALDEAARWIGERLAKKR